MRFPRTGFVHPGRVGVSRSRPAPADPRGASAASSAKWFMSLEHDQQRGARASHAAARRPVRPRSEATPAVSRRPRQCLPREPAGQAGPKAAIAPRWRARCDGPPSSNVRPVTPFASRAAKSGSRGQLAAGKQPPPVRRHGPSSPERPVSGTKEQSPARESATRRNTAAASRPE